MKIICGDKNRAEAAKLFSAQNGIIAVGKKDDEFAAIVSGDEIVGLIDAIFDCQNAKIKKAKKDGEGKGCFT